MELSIFLLNYESDSLSNMLLAVFQCLCREAQALLNVLVKTEATVCWARFCGVNVRGIFTRDMWPGVKPGHVRENAKSREESEALKVPHTRGAQSPFPSLKSFLCRT